MPTLELVTDDITTVQVDAIVNAANPTLLGGGGVDGAIHRGAGPELLAVCQGLNGCETGSAKITPGFLLPAVYIIHTVGPVWQGGHQGEAALLASCYNSCLQLAFQHQLDSIAFPAISTGVFGYPKDQACAIATESISHWHEMWPRRVFIVCFDAETLALYRQLLRTE